jgi:tetratricopeptide (TPR) repeat protein
LCAGRLEESLEDAEAALQLLQGSAKPAAAQLLAKAAHRKAEALLALGDVVEAVRAYRRGLAAAPGHPELHAALRLAAEDLPVPWLAAYWAARVEEAQAPNPLSSRDGRLVKRVPSELALGPQDLRAHLQAALHPLQDEVGRRGAEPSPVQGPACGVAKRPATRSSPKLPHATKLPALSSDRGLPLAQARDLMCEAWAEGRRPGRAAAALMRSAAYLGAGNAKQALKDARFALATGPQLDTSLLRLAEEEEKEARVDLAEKAANRALAPSNGGGGGGGGDGGGKKEAAPRLEDSLPPGALAGRTSAWPAALALHSAALEALPQPDTVLAALSLARAAELEPENEEYAAGLERLMRRIPEHQAAALRVRRDVRAAPTTLAAALCRSSGLLPSVLLPPGAPACSQPGCAPSPSPPPPRLPCRPEALRRWRRSWRGSARRRAPSSCAAARAITTTSSGCGAASRSRCGVGGSWGWCLLREQTCAIAEMRLAAFLSASEATGAAVRLTPHPSLLVVLPRGTASTPHCLSPSWTRCCPWRPTSWTCCCSTPRPRS